MADTLTQEVVQTGMGDVWQMCLALSERSTTFTPLTIIMILYDCYAHVKQQASQRVDSGGCHFLLS